MTRASRKLHKDRQREAEIKPIRAAIIAESASLPIWQRDGGGALYYLLTAFEYETQQRLLDARRRRDDTATVGIPGVAADLGTGLNAAVHEIYLRHPDLLFTAPPDPFDPQALDEGRGTLIYCSRFASVIDALDAATARGTCMSTGRPCPCPSPTRGPSSTKRGRPPTAA